MGAGEGCLSLPDLARQHQREIMEYMSLPNMESISQLRHELSLKSGGGKRLTCRKNRRNAINQQKKYGELTNIQKGYKDANQGTKNSDKNSENSDDGSDSKTKFETEFEKKGDRLRELLGLNREEVPVKNIENNPDYREDSKNEETSVKTMCGGEEHDEEEKIEKDGQDTEKDQGRIVSESCNNNKMKKEVEWFKDYEEDQGCFLQENCCKGTCLGYGTEQSEAPFPTLYRPASIYRSLVKIGAMEPTPEATLSSLKALQKVDPVEAKNLLNKLIQVVLHLSSKKLNFNNMEISKEKLCVGEQIADEAKIEVDQELRENPPDQGESGGNLPTCVSQLDVDTASHDYPIPDKDTEGVGPTDNAVSTSPNAAEVGPVACDQKDQVKKPRNGKSVKPISEYQSEKVEISQKTPACECVKRDGKRRRKKHHYQQAKRDLHVNFTETRPVNVKTKQTKKRNKARRKRKLGFDHCLREIVPISCLPPPGKNVIYSNGDPGENRPNRERVLWKEKRMDVRKTDFSCLARSRPTGGATGGGGARFHQSSSNGPGNRGNTDDTSKDSTDSDKDGDDTEKGPGDGRDKKVNDHSSSHPVLRRQSATRTETLTGNIPAPDYKAFRKKPDDLCGHGEPPGGVVEILGFLSQDQEFTPESIEALAQVDKCLVKCFHDLQNGMEQESVSTCLTCTVIFSLLQHFGRDSNTIPGQCSTCMQLFKLVRFHLDDCCLKGTPLETCDHTLAMCRRIHRQVVPFTKNPTDLITYLWGKLKEFLSRVYGGNEILMKQQPAAQRTGIKKPSLRRKVSARSSTLGKIAELPTDEEGRAQPESFQSGSSGNKGTNSQIISGPGSLRIEHDFNQVIYSQTGGIDHSSFHSSNVQVNSGGVGAYSLTRQSRETSHTSFILRGLTEGPLHLPPRDGPVHTELGTVFQQQGCQSLPLGHVARPLTEQLKSLEDRPTGEPGIGEVVYSERGRLAIIANHWSDIRQKYQRGETIPRVSREEGVVLKEMMNTLQIGKTRYQQDIQWQKLSYLGRGVSGKCHLAVDLNSDFQFCVKEMLITNFTADELVIWSGLDHPNIVKLYGAIRAGVYIYIFAEFIDGGCLTEHINNQRQLNRRLSKSMALEYFDQLLNVLVYLESENVIHEDLKADNILLRRTNSGGKLRTVVVVADFGLANKLQPGQRIGKTSPIGSQTQWSPEKAASWGYDFRSDIWAATCVFVHIFNGDPPWVRRFGHAGLLHFIISDQSPPLEDMPKKITTEIEHLIRLGWREERDRPNAAELLKHTRRCSQLYSTAVSSQLDSLWSTVSGPLIDPTQRELEGIIDYLDQTNQNRPSRLVPSEHEDVTSTSLVHSRPPEPSAEKATSSLDNQIGETALTWTTPQPPDDQIAAVGAENVHRDLPATGGNKIDSDPGEHLQRFIKDQNGVLPDEESATGLAPELEVYDSNNAAVTTTIAALLPNLSVFEIEDDTVIGGEYLENTAIEGSNSPLFFTQSPHSGSSSNVSFFKLDESRIDSGDMFGSGPDPLIKDLMSLPTLKGPKDVEMQSHYREPQSLINVRVLGRVQPDQLGYQAGKATREGPSTEGITSLEGPTSVVACTTVPASPEHPISPKLHLQLPVPGQTRSKPPLMRSSVSFPALSTMPNNVLSKHRASEPNTALPTVRVEPDVLTDTSGVDVTMPWSHRGSPQSGQSGSSSQTSGFNTSTPKSASSSTYDNQEKEMKSLTSNLYQELGPFANASEIELQTWEDDNDEDDDGDILNIPADQYHSHLSCLQQQLNFDVVPDSNGALIKFVSKNDELITPVRIRDPCKEWHEVIVDIAAPVIHHQNYLRFCVYHRDGSIVDMSATVGGADISVVVVHVKEEECQTWYVENHQFHWN